MTELDLKAIEERAAKATPGPWDPDAREQCNEHYVAGCGPWHLKYAPHYERAEADANFIAAARSDIPALLAEVRRLREMVAAVTQHRDICSEAVKERDTLIAELQAEVAAWEETAKEYDVIEAERDTLKAELSMVLAERDGAVSMGTQLERERERLKQALAADPRIASHHATCARCGSSEHLICEEEK